MAVRNCAEVGENLQKVVQRLMANDDLVKLLYYTDQDPLSHEALTDAQKTELIFNKLIKIIPRVGANETANSIVAVRVLGGTRNRANNEFRDVEFSFEIYVPLTQWFIKGTNLRPFSILGEVQKSLDGKTINGLGRMDGGDFEIEFITEEIICYEQHFSLITYD